MTLWIKYIPLLLAGVLLSACSYESESDKTWTHDKKGLFTAAYSHDGQFVLVAGTSGPARIINTQLNTTLHEWQHTDTNDGIIASSISANNKFAVTAEKNSLALWEVDSGKIIGYWDFPNINKLVISANGQHALIALEDHTAYYFDLYYGKIIYTFQHDGIINTVALSKNGQYAMTGGNAHQAKLWNLKTGEIAQQWAHNFKIYKVALSDDGRHAMSNASLGKTRLWDTASGQLLSQLPMRYMTVSAGRFSPDGLSLLTGRPNQRIDLWDVATGKRLKTWIPKRRYFWRPDSAAIIGLAFSADGQYFYSEASSGIAQKWRITPH